MQRPSPLPSCPPTHSNTAAASRCLLLPIACFLLFPAPINRLQPTLSSSSPAAALTAVAHSYFVLCSLRLLPPTATRSPPTQSLPSIASRYQQQPIPTEISEPPSSPLSRRFLLLVPNSASAIFLPCSSIFAQ
ncbi:hypothetical protein GW17_00007569 [Ensete ventricosum]|nr:hypothetical protein GW17_00007569 [Ensete ventricosum]